MHMKEVSYGVPDRTLEFLLAMPIASLMHFVDTSISDMSMKCTRVLLLTEVQPYVTVLQIRQCVSFDFHIELPLCKY